MELLEVAPARVLAVVAHPDDIEYGAAAAVAQWSANGADCRYLLATRGEAGIDAIDPADAAPLREAEQRAGAAVLGVDVVEFLDHPDGVIEYSIALRRDIAEAIRRHRPDTVLLFNHRENWGPGHATVPTTRPSVAPHSMRSRMLGTAGFFPEQNLTASSAPSSPGHLSRPTRSTYLLELTSPSLRCPNIAPTSKALANTRWQIPNSFEDS